MKPQQPLRRIAILGSRGYPSTYGGYETLVRIVAPMWVEQGLDVSVYCRSRFEGHRAWVQDGIHCRWTPGVENKSASTLSYGLTSHLDVSRRKFDAALVLNVANGFFLPLLNRSGVGCALNTDGIEWGRDHWGSNAQRVIKAGALMGAKRADVLVADSKAIAEFWHSELGVESEFIAYGAPVLEGLGSDQVEELGLKPGSYALVVARFRPENNVELILDAIESEGDIPAVIVGDANFESPTQRRLEAMNRDGKALWLGHVGDQVLLNQLWANCGVYLHGHSVGGTNPSLLQAMGAGAPVLALDTPFNREVIEDQEQLFPADVAVLNTLIRQVLSDPELAKRWVERSKTTIAERYSWQDVADRYLEVLDLARRRRRAMDQLH